MRGKISIIIPPYHKRNGSSTFFPLGIGYISSYLSQFGYSVHILDFTENVDDIDIDISETTISEMICSKYGLVDDNLMWGIGPVTTASAPIIKYIVDTIRTISKKPIVCGGPLASIEDQKWFFFDFLHVDAIVRGDGEEALLSLVDLLAQGNSVEDCDKVSTKEYSAPFQTIENIDDLPFPLRPVAEDCGKMHASIRRGVLPYPVTTIVTMRGCPYRCPFCVSGNLREYAKFSSDRIINELKEIERLGYKSVIFFDDCMFFGNRAKSDIAEFCHKIKENDVKLYWTMELRPDVFQTLTEREFKLLSECGCKEINIGFESVSKDAQKLYRKRYNPQLIIDACNCAISNNIIIAGTFIIGGPTETIDSIEATINFAKESGIIFAHFTPLEIYPGTPLYSSMFGTDPKAWFFAQQKEELGWNEVIFDSENMSADILIKKSSLAYEMFYDEEWKKRVRKIIEKDLFVDTVEMSEMIRNRYNFIEGGNDGTV